MQKRPFVMALVCYILGEVCGIVSIRKVPMVFISITVFILCYLCYPKKKIAVCIVFGILFLLGFLRWEQETNVAKITKSSEVKINGTICDTIKGTNKEQMSLFHCVFYCNNKKYECSKKIMMSIKDNSYPVGTMITATGTLYPLEPARNPGGFNSALYYRGLDVLYTFAPNDIKVVGKENSPWLWYKDQLKKVKNFYSNCYDRLLEEKESGICKAMVLGEKSTLDQEQKKLYQDAGIAHILAISGLHIAFWGVGLFRILRKSIGYYLPSAVLSACLAMSYVFLVGMSGSAVRALVMLLVSFLGQTLGKQYDMLSAMSFAALGILFFQPLQLIQCGFLLSFGAIIGIAVCYPMFTKKEKKKKKKPSLAGKIKNQILLSYSIQLVTIPILLLFFYQVPVYGIFLNILVLPLMSVLLPFAVLGGILGVVSFTLGQIALCPAVWILHFYQFMCETVNQLPGAIWTPGSPMVSQILCYYGVLIIVYVCKKKLKKQWIPLLSIFALAFMIRPSSFTLRITALDVGQGNGIYIELPTKENFFYDCGSSSEPNLYEDTLDSFLKYNGRKDINAAFVTHGDLDHMNGITALLENNIRITHLYLPKIEKKDEAYCDMEQLAKKKGSIIHYIAKGDELKIGEVMMECGYPAANISYEDRNEYSMTMYIRYKDFSALLPGDLQGEGEEVVKDWMRENCEKHGDLTALIVAHHGSKNSTSEAFLNVLNPKYGIISAGENNQYGHPNIELLKRIENVKCKIYSTIEQGAVVIESSKTGGRIYGYKGKNMIE